MMKLIKTCSSVREKDPAAAELKKNKAPRREKLRHRQRMGGKFSLSLGANNKTQTHTCTRLKIIYTRRRSARAAAFVLRGAEKSFPLLSVLKAARGFSAAN